MVRLAEATAKFLARRAAARLEERLRRHRGLTLVLALTSIPVAAFAGVLFLTLMILLAIVAGNNSGGCGTTAPPVIPANISASANQDKTAGAFVRYFESQGDSANAAAGITGNLWQESSLDPTGYQPGIGGGLAGWQPAWYATMATYARSKGLSPTSDAGQLAYIVFDARTSYASLLAQMNAASDPGTAATMWETGYEKCSGVLAFMVVVPNSPCMDGNRRAYAARALRDAGGGSSAIPASAVTTGQCVLANSTTVNTKGQTDPAPGATWGRLDMGFDGNYGGQGAVAPYAGTIHYGSITGWPGQGVYFWVLNANQSGPDFTRCMYFAEGATPVVVSGARVSAGEHIGSPVAAGGDGSPGNFEIGPCSTTNFDTLTKTYGNYSPGARAMVMRFYNWMRSLGAGPTTDPSAAGGP